MLRFFRQIRQNLISENNFRKYFLYVTGEIIIVIAGILIALQLDNWNTERQDRNEARVFMIRLKNEFQDNRDQMVQKIQMRQRALESSRELLRIVDNRAENTTREQVDSLLANALPVYTFDPSQGVLNQLTSTDKLTLFRNEALNNKLSAWTSMIEDFKEDENMYNSYNHNHFRPYLYENYNGRNVINSRIRNKVISPILLSSPESVNTEIGFSDKPVELAVLLKSIAFENYLAFCVSWLSLINTQSEGVLNYIDEVLMIIDEELESAEKK